MYSNYILSQKYKAAAYMHSKLHNICTLVTHTVHICEGAVKIGHYVHLLFCIYAVHICSYSTHIWVVQEVCYIYIVSYGIRIMFGVLTLLGLYQDVFVLTQA